MSTTAQLVGQPMPPTSLVPPMMAQLAGAGLIHQTISAVNGPWIQANGRWLLNFASSNYLGLAQHPQLRPLSDALLAHHPVSLSMPRFLGVDPLTLKLERKLARMTAQAAALLFPSTTHIALDVIPLLAGPRGVIFIDEWAYPISVEGAYAATRAGARLVRFPHNDVKALARLLHRHRHTSGKVIVCDGVYSAGGGAAPLAQMAALAQRFGAYLYVDDAHSFGVLGESPSSAMSYGHGGGGTHLHQGVASDKLIYVSSMSKALGIPVAFVAGPKPFINHLRQNAGSTVHSSPPSLQSVAAALASLLIHDHDGEQLRRRLVRNIFSYQRALSTLGTKLNSSDASPIQTIAFPSSRRAFALAHFLRNNGVFAVVQFAPPDVPHGAVLRFLITTEHSRKDFDFLRKLLRAESFNLVI